MRLAKYLLLGAVAASVAACSDDDDGISPRGPAALVRFVNASPDAGRVNARFVDDPLENLPNWLNVPFRGTSGMFQQVVAGERDFRIFFYTLDADSAKVTLIDETITLEEGQMYTIVYTGTVAGDADEILVVEEAIPDDPGAGQLAIRAWHAAMATGAVDIYASDSSSNPLTAPDFTIMDVATGEITPYQTVATLASPELYEFAVTDAGAVVRTFGATPNQPGASATSTLSAQAGVRQSGSVLTAFLVPGATPGSRAATTNSSGAQTNADPSIVLLLDNIPGT